MLASHRLELRSSAIRSRLNSLSLVEELSDEERSETDHLQAEFPDVEQRRRSALIVESEQAAGATFEGDNAELRELRDLTSRAGAVRIVDSVLAGHAPSGAEAELQQHYNLAANEIPASLLIEERANAFPTDVGGDARPTMPMIFPSSVQEFAGIARESVQPGAAIYPIITAPTNSPDAVAGAAAVADTDFTLAASPLKAERVQRSFVFAREQMAQLGSLESDLRRTLNDNLADALDQHALRDATAGLFDFGTDPTAETTRETYLTYQSKFFSQLDGRYADSLSDLHVLVGAATLKDMGSLYRTTASEISALDWATKMAHVRLTAHAKAAASNVQEAIAIRTIGGPHVVQPVWGGVQVIRDEITSAAKGEIRLTAVVLTAVAVVRTAAVNRLSFKVG